MGAMAANSFPTEALATWADDDITRAKLLGRANKEHVMMDELAQWMTETPEHADGLCEIWKYIMSLSWS